MTMALTLTKYFFVLFCCLYAYQKILNVQSKKHDVWYQLTFAIFITPLVSYVRTSIPLTTLFVLIFLVEVFAMIHYKTEPTVNFRVSILSFGISYILCVLSAIALSLLSIIPVFKADYSPISTMSFSLLVGILQVTLTVLLFKVRRFQRGIPNFVSHFSGDIGVFLGMLILLLASMAYIDEATKIMPAVIIFFTVITGMILYLWYRKYIANDYMQRAQNRSENILEEKVKVQSMEIEQLSKIIHKDNKLIAALKLTVSQLQTEMANEHCKHLLEELETLVTERTEILTTYQQKESFLAKTGVFSIDMMLNYLVEKALSVQCSFEVSIIGDIRYMTDNIINKRDLSTLIADIGENALNANSELEVRKVLLLLGVEDNCYHLDVYDNGRQFCKETISKLGRERYTTHKKDGGSGIGLMTVLELARKYRASFEIEEMTESISYTKRVSVVFDNLLQIRIDSEREEIPPQNLENHGNEKIHL